MTCSLKSFQIFIGDVCLVDFDSIVVQLTDPSEYEGGDLEILTTENPFWAAKEKGSCILFPSFCLHKVHPVTKGLRNSLVLWVSGPPFE